MNPANWRRVKELLDAALQAPAAERDAFIAAQTGDAEVLADTIRPMLQRASRD